MKYFIYAIIGIVGAAIVAGFFVAGSPKEQRLRRFDAQRIQDLQMIQSWIVNYWQSKRHLPGSLADLKDELRGIIVPHDPETGSEYGYEVRGPEMFALCAEFARPSSPVIAQERSVPETVKAPYSSGGVFEGLVWDYAAGRVCFERTIDKDFFPPTKKD